MQCSHCIIARLFLAHLQRDILYVFTLCCTLYVGSLRGLLNLITVLYVRVNRIRAWAIINYTPLTNCIEGSHKISTQPFVRSHASTGLNSSRWQRSTICRPHARDLPISNEATKLLLPTQALEKQFNISLEIKLRLLEIWRKICAETFTMYADLHFNWIRCLVEYIAGSQQKLQLGESEFLCEEKCLETVRLLGSFARNFAFSIR